MSSEDFVVDRRTAVVGASVAAAAAAMGFASASRASAAPVPTTECAAQPVTIAATADIPVGGGQIIGDVVVTQPTEGTFRAFCATCTHLGCHLVSVKNDTINCPCHGSKFHLDGTVAHGPALIPLISRTVRVEGDSVVLEPFVQGVDIPCLPSLPNLFPNLPTS